jgi:hypothetical protein
VSIFKIGSCAPGALSLLLTFAKYSCARPCHELHSKLARSLRSVSPLGRRWCAWVEAGVAGLSRPARIRSHMRTDRWRFAAASRRPSARLVRLWQRHCCMMRASCSTRRTRKPMRTFGRRSPLHLWLTHDAVDACNVEANDRQHATCNMQRAACSMQRAACSMQRAACNVQHATRSILHATGSMQRAA